MSGPGGCVENPPSGTATAAGGYCILLECILVYYIVLLSPANEVWGTGNIFIDVCLSTGGGGLLLKETPLDRDLTHTHTHMDRDPPPLYSKERAVRILLKCILVFHCLLNEIQ